MTQFRNKLPLLALAATLLALPSVAQDTNRPVQSVRVVVLDPISGTEYANVAPGDTIQLPAGEERVLRLYEPQGTRGQVRRWLPATFGFGNEVTPLELLRVDADRGEAAVRLRPGATTTGQQGRLHVGWRLADRVRVQNDGLRLGRVLVDVLGTTQGSTGVYPTGDVLTALYRGILLRDPDPGSSGYANNIARSGYAAVVRTAEDMARSPESDRGVYDRGTNQQRLQALYENLLGRRVGDVDPREWDANLAAMSRGDVEGVVADMVRSEAFRTRFGYR